MTDVQKELIEVLNDMYQSQSAEFKKQYREHYFALLEYLTD